MNDDAVARRPIKCVVWDLDGTLWPGTLAEGDPPVPEPERAALVRELDARGVLQSIASRNLPGPALAALERAGLGDYFLHPQFDWGSKAAAVEAIAGNLAIHTGSLALVDDDPFERAEVASSLPEVRTFAPDDLPGLLRHPAIPGPSVTREAASRSRLYREELQRSAVEARLQAPRQDFLAALGLVLAIRRAGSADIARASELTVRTNQLNATGLTYSPEQLGSLIGSPDHLLLAADLRDRFGDYGTIGLALIATAAPAWRLLLFTVSCRVMNRGAGTVFLNWILAAAARLGRRIEANFRHTGLNRPMYVAYRFAGFRERGEEDGFSVLEHDSRQVHPCPPHMRVETGGGLP